MVLMVVLVVVDRVEMVELVELELRGKVILAERVVQLMDMVPAAVVVPALLVLMEPVA
jgi:hypothetical protein